MKIVIDIPEHMYLKAKADILWRGDILVKAIKNGIPLEQTEVLDNIRAEIKTKYDSIPWRDNAYDDGWIEALEWVYDDVIDKYKESEDKKMNKKLAKLTVKISADYYNKVIKALEDAGFVLVLDWESTTERYYIVAESEVEE